MESQRFSTLCRSALLAVVTLAGVLGTASGVAAQALKDLQTPDTPLVLKAQGSFFVGGEKAEQTQVELGGLGPGGHITVNQMYVRYMVPQGGDGNVPVVMVHGATLTGKSWETTPDGRMGWDEYFVRKGHPVYVPDQVGRGRSGFNQAALQRRARGLGAGGQPPALAAIQRRGRLAELPLRLEAWRSLPGQSVPGDRRGRALEAGCARRQLWRPAHAQPDVQGVVGSRRSIEWRGADGTLAVRPRFRWRRRCSIPTRPGVSCWSSRVSVPARYTDEQIKTLATVPVLVVFGDHRDTPTGISSRPSWQLSFDGCQELIGRLKAAGGQAQMLDPAERGIRGNSHMIMQDKNNLQIADLILQWIDEHVGKRSGGKQVTAGRTGKRGIS